MPVTVPRSKICGCIKFACRVLEVCRTHHVVTFKNACLVSRIVQIFELFEIIGGKRLNDTVLIREWGVVRIGAQAILQNYYLCLANSNLAQNPGFSVCCTTSHARFAHSHCSSDRDGFPACVPEVCAQQKYPMCDYFLRRVRIVPSLCKVKTNANRLTNLQNLS
jgi:hypothetical protein